MTQAEQFLIEDSLAEAKDRSHSPDDLDLWLLECAADLQPGDPASRPSARPPKGLREDQVNNQLILQAILDASPVGIMWMKHRIIKSVNPAACTLLGYEAGELVGKTSRMLYISDRDYGEVGASAADRLDANRTARLETRWRCKSGRVIDVYIQVRSLVNGQTEHGYIVTAEDITERKLNEKRLRIYQNRLRKLALEVTQAEEQERQRLAETVHDGLGQTLAMIRIGLKSVLATKPRGRERGLQDLVGLVDRAFQETREITAELSPPILRDIGLEAALAWLADNTFRRHGVVTHFHSDWKGRDLSRDTAAVLFRITQELVINAVKHGRPHLVAIYLTSGDQGLQIMVQDDGRGFDISLLNNEVPLGFGLFSVSERVKSMGGRLRIGSRPGKGTVVIITLPKLDPTGREEQ